MRRIDLLCKLLAPILAGVLLGVKDVGGFGTTLFIAAWNIVSFFGELGLLWAVYKMLPSLAVKRLRKGTRVVEAKDEDEEKDEEEKYVKFSPIDNKKSSKSTLVCLGYCSKLATPYRTLKNGFKIFIRQEIALVGFALAAIYLTVLGFSGVTSTYFVTQGLHSGWIGFCYGLGGVVGVSGTLVYPYLRKRVGTVRAGLVGFSLQLTLLLFCLVAVFAPGVPTTSNNDQYYSANCSLNDTDSIVPVPTQSYSSFSATSSIVGNVLQDRTADNISTTASRTHLSFSVTPTSQLHLPVSSRTSSLIATPHPSSNTSSILATSSFSLLVDPSLLNSRVLSTTPFSYSSVFPSPTIVPSPRPPQSSGDNGVSISVIFMLVGVVGARFGLWMFDLTVSQLVQERVKEEERGVVSGVMNAMNSNMDMLQYVLVIIAPRPEHFRWLALLSVAMVFIGWVFYACYVRKARGHFFHFSKLRKFVSNKKSNGQPQPQLTLINTMADIQDDDDEEKDD